jgi:hypothetical protein
MLRVIFCGSARVDGTIVYVSNQSFRMRSSSLWKYFFFESREDICRKVFAIHSGTSRKFIKYMEFELIPDKGKREFYHLNIAPWFCDDLISGKRPHSERQTGSKEPQLVPGERMMSSIFRGTLHERYHPTRVSALLVFY